MAERISGRDSLQSGLLQQTPEVEGAQGMSLEELKASKGPALNADVAPLAEPQLYELIGAVGRNTDDLRLNVPPAMSPYAASPSGIRQNTYFTRNFLNRFSDLEKLIAAAQSPSSPLSERGLALIRGSLPRVAKAMSLVKDTQAMSQEISYKAMRSQEK